jgi:TRAP-type C4-dicarboxylate transport system substrate-binding protein
VPGVGFAYLPYLCTSYEEVQEKYYNGWIGEIVKKRLSKANIELLAFMDNDFRWITNSKHPILKPEDLKGLSIRVPEIPELIKFFDELGAQPTTMAVTEVVPALQQGAVDGQDNGAILNYTYGFHEFQPYMTVTNHVFSGGGLIVNKNLWDSLSSEEQQIIKEAADKCAGMANKKLRSNIPEYINKMREGGARIDKPTPALDKAMQEAAQRVWNDPRNAKRYGEEVINKIVN